MWVGAQSVLESPKDLRFGLYNNIFRNDEEFDKASSYLNSVLKLWDEELG